MKPILLLALSFLILNCNSKPSYNDPIPEHDTFTIASKRVNEIRVINIWTPPKYIEENESYPVLFMPDGGIKEDFSHIANTISKLVKAKSIPPIILVGIENTERGRDLTGASQSDYDAQFCPLTDGAKDFRAFILEELVPEINKKYRTQNKKGLLGESLAGLFVMETFFKSPSSFDFYIAMDPSLWWNDHQMVSEAKSYFSSFPETPISLWYAGSSAEDISNHTKTLEAKLNQSAPENLTWTYSDEPNEQHHTIFRATKEKALVWTFKNL
ncbi:alpha/beta hydrolase [Psychroserpens sp. XS_ASV72]|uniref:alpha/beta hydrolase n=1 Tax=Psychroserpens sp. XS_ASV72 TaxID=3241293 RepID=UPI00351367D7